MEEGGGGIENTVLFGKYQLCRVLGTGRAGTVFLAVHLGLEEYRAVKRVPKSCLDYGRFRKEALVLKELRHPGIPIVYDLEEDQEYSYLIEEYLEGESLYALVSEEGPLSRGRMIHHGVSICRIVMYLHSAGPNPILHLDLQPKNLLLCHGAVKLIDFDHAACIADANAEEQRYGTAGCAAPEQYSGETLDTRTDIYAIGALLYYFGTGYYPDRGAQMEAAWGRELAAVIRDCLNPVQELRPLSVSSVCERLERLECKGTGVFTKKQASSLTIALTGSKSGVGTTHLSIGLSVYLNHQGYPNVYEEKNNSGAALQLGEYFNAAKDRFGLMKHHSFVWKPEYGPCVKLEEHSYSVKVRDYGTDWIRAAEDCPDQLILVCGGKGWDHAKSVAALASLKKNGAVPRCLIYNQTVSGVHISPLAGVDLGCCCRAPLFCDPFMKKNVNAGQFYRAVLDRMEIPAGGREKRGLLDRLIRRVWKR